MLDTPITFTATLDGPVSLGVDDFIYVFEVRNTYPRDRTEVQCTRNCTVTKTFAERDYSSGHYIMDVRVYTVIWGYKGWLIAETEDKFELEST